MHKTSSLCVWWWIQSQGKEIEKKTRQKSCSHHRVWCCPWGRFPNRRPRAPDCRSRSSWTWRIRYEMSTSGLSRTRPSAETCTSCSPRSGSTFSTSLLAMQDYKPIDNDKVIKRFPGHLQGDKLWMIHFKNNSDTAGKITFPPMDSTSCSHVRQWTTFNETQIFRKKFFLGSASVTYVSSCGCQWRRTWLGSPPE